MEPNRLDGSISSIIIWDGYWNSQHRGTGAEIGNWARVCSKCMIMLNSYHIATILYSSAAGRTVIIHNQHVSTNYQQLDEQAENNAWNYGRGPYTRESTTWIILYVRCTQNRHEMKPASILWFTTALKEALFWKFCVSLHISIVPFWRLTFDGTSRFHQSIEELVDDEANENFEEVPPNPEYADPAATKTNWQHTIMAYSLYSQQYKACTWADHDHSIIRIKHLIIAGKRGALDRTSCSHSSTTTQINSTLRVAMRYTATYEDRCF